MRSFLQEVDIGAIRERFDAYWRREVPERPLVAITAPRREHQEPDFPVPDSLQDRWMDPQYQLRRQELAMENTLFLGEAIPSFYPNLGPDSFTAFLGAELRFVDESTSWVVPFVEDLAQWEPQLDPKNPWWVAMMNLIDAGCEAAQGRYLVATPDLHGGGDALAAARHPDRLACDLYDKPEEVRRLVGRMTEIYVQVCEAYFAKIFPIQQGSTTWLPAYGRGKYSALQNDFSGLVSPEMFQEFFLEDIARLAEYVDNSIYHLDGPMALGNLEHLLGIQALDGIQWVPGAGSKPMSEWSQVCRRVLEAGKCLQVNCTPPEVEVLLSRLPHEGLFITTSCSTEGEARELLRRVEGSG